MTRLHGSLPTLEDAISGRQPRLGSGGWSALSGRGDPRRVSTVGFWCSLFYFFNVSFRFIGSVLLRAPSPPPRALVGARKLECFRWYVPIASIDRKQLEELAETGASVTVPASLLLALIVKIETNLGLEG